MQGFRDSLMSWFDRQLAPHTSHQDIEQRRQSRLLSGIILTFLLTVSVGIVILLIQGSIKTLTLTIPIWIIHIGLYWLNRSGHYRTSANIMVLFNYVMMPVATVATGDLIWLYFGGMVMIFSALFLSLRATWVLFFISLVLQLIIANVKPIQTQMDNTGPFIVFLVTGALVIVFLNHRYGLERERQAELQETNIKLRKSEAELENRVEERTRDLVVLTEQLKKADHIKSQFLASMSHELRTPLNAIINFTEFVALEMMGPVNEPQKEALTKSINSSRHLLALINDVLDMTKIAGGMLQLLIEPEINLVPEIEVINSTAQTLLKDKPQVTYQAEFPENLPLMTVDKRRIRQILLNLISNACKFTEQGSVILRVTVEPDHLLFVVLDTGPGIPEDKLEAIFEPFVQTDTGIKHASGTGLGLPISRSLAEAHGGTLWVESVQGAGASFYFKLPYQAQVHAVLEQPQPQA